MNNQDLMNNIKSQLGMLSYHVSISSSINQLSINIHCEQFFLELLNELFEYDLKNSNFSEQNFASIDLIDEIKKIAIQVTSDNTLKKTKTTLSKFTEKNLHFKVNRLVILNIVKKSIHREKFLESSGFKIDTKKDIWDNTDLIKSINDLKIDRLITISSLINKYLNPNILYPAPPTNQIKLSTIHRLLEGISELKITTSITPLDTTPYKIEQKISHNKIQQYVKYFDKFQNLSWTIQTQLDFLEQNGQAGISEKLYTYIDKKFMHYELLENNPDIIIHKICDDIEKDLKANSILSVNLDDISYIPYVVFFVFSKCKIFEKPPCLS